MQQVSSTLCHAYYGTLYYAIQTWTAAIIQSACWKRAPVSVMMCCKWFNRNVKVICQSKRLILITCISFFFLEGGGWRCSVIACYVCALLACLPLRYWKHNTTATTYAMSNGVLHNDVYNIPPHFNFCRRSVYTYMSPTYDTTTTYYYYLLF